MTGILHTFAPLSTDPTRGTHAFTTQDAGEALALFHALAVRDRLADLLSLSGPILEAMEATHGQSGQFQAVAAAFLRAEDVHREAAPSDPQSKEPRPCNRIA